MASQLSQTGNSASYPTRTTLEQLLTSASLTFVCLATRSSSWRCFRNRGPYKTVFEIKALIKPIVMTQVTDKTRADVKGGTLIQYEGRLRLLEVAQVGSSGSLTGLISFPPFRCRRTTWKSSWTSRSSTFSTRTTCGSACQPSRGWWGRRPWTWRSLSIRWRSLGLINTDFPNSGHLVSWKHQCLPVGHSHRGRHEMLWQCHRAQRAKVIGTIIITTTTIITTTLNWTTTNASTLQCLQVSIFAGEENKRLDVGHVQSLFSPPWQHGHVSKGMTKIWN